MTLAVSARNAPRLHHAELQDELERLLSKHHRSSLVAFYGSSDAGELTLRHGQRLRIIPTESELLLRERLPEPGVRAGEHGEWLVYLVDWATELPLDISARLAGGRLHHLAREARLASLFGAYQVSPDLVQSALSRVLLKHSTPQPLPRVTAQVLQRSDAFRRLLYAQLGVPMERTATLHSLLGWCAWTDGNKTLHSLSQTDDDWRALRSELHAWLRDQWGPLALAAWIAWEHNAGQRFAAFCTLIEAWQEASLNQPEIARYGRGLLTGMLAQDAWKDVILEAATQLNDPSTVDAILRPPPELRPSYSPRDLLILAQSFITDPDFNQDIIARSKRLPLGYSARRARLAEALRAPHLTNTTRSTAPHEALDDLRSHHDSKHHPDDLARSEMGLRLSNYLTFRASHPPDALHKTPAYVEALELAAAYANDGGYIDRARTLLRRTPKTTTPRDPLDDTLDTILADADADRDADDARFAAGLPAWLEASRPEVTQVAAACALPDLMTSWVHVFLKEKQHRKLIVVVLRGMSTAEASALAETLGNEPDQWQPMGWRPDKYKALGGMPAAIMSWPTHAENTLAAFLTATPHTTPTSKSPPLQRHTIESFADPEGNLHAEAVHALQAEDYRLITVTIPKAQWREDGMKLLRDLLLVAATTDRAALLVSDRGAIPGDRLKHSRYDADDAGGRWRTRGKRTEQRTASEVALRSPSGDEVWALWDSTICHGISAQGAVEAWGGASLAEVVVPALWLAPRRLSASLDGGRDTALSTHPATPPVWWNLHNAPPAQETKPAPALQSPLAPLPAQQVMTRSIPHNHAAAVSTPPPRAESAMEQALKASAYFQAHVEQGGYPRDRVENALLLIRILEGSGWSMSKEQFAERIGKSAHHVQPWVGEVRAILSREGYSAVEMDALQTRVRLKVDILTQLFELDEGA